MQKTPALLIRPADRVLLTVGMFEDKSRLTSRITEKSVLCPSSVLDAMQFNLRSDVGNNISHQLKRMSKLFYEIYNLTAFHSVSKNNKICHSNMLLCRTVLSIRTPINIFKVN